MQEIERLLLKHGISPDHLLDQCFMRDRGIIEKIISLAGPGLGDTVLEIGAGIGTLTAPLAKKAGHVVAVEIDRKLAKALRDSVAGMANVEIVFGNALELAAGVKFDLLVSNTPYSICEPLVRLLAHCRFRSCVLALPENFTDTLMAARKSDKYTPLSFFFQHFFDCEKAFRVPDTAFFPQPGVGSCVIKMWPRKPRGSEKLFREFMLLDRMKTANAFREALIKAGRAGTKNAARDIVAGAGISRAVLEKRVKDLAVEELEIFAAATLRHGEDDI